MLNFVETLLEVLKLLAKLQHIPLPYFIEQKSLPKFVIIINIWIVRLTLGRGNIKMLAKVRLIVNFEFLNPFQDLSLNFGYSVVNLSVDLIWVLSLL